MQTAWPSAAATDPVTGRAQYYPGSCTSGGLRRPPLPEPGDARGGQLRAARPPPSFRTSTSSTNVTWTTKVRDNGGALANAYDPTHADDAQAGCPVPAGVTPATACTYDANGDRELWVQSQAIVRGKPRNVVARLRLEQLARERAADRGRRPAPSRSPTTATTAARRSSTRPVAGVVRCADPTDASCADFEPGQIKPGAPLSDATAPEPDDRPSSCSASSSARSSTATYFAGCPARTAATTSPARWSGSRAAPTRRTSEQGPDDRLRRRRCRRASTRTA